MPLAQLAQCLRITLDLIYSSCSLVNPMIVLKQVVSVPHKDVIFSFQKTESQTHVWLESSGS